jgi:hypothetical protein
MTMPTFIFGTTGPSTRPRLRAMGARQSPTNAGILLCIFRQTPQGKEQRGFCVSSFSEMPPPVLNIGSQLKCRVCVLRGYRLWSPASGNQLHQARQ